MLDQALCCSFLWLLQIWVGKITPSGFKGRSAMMTAFYDIPQYKCAKHAKATEAGWTFHAASISKGRTQLCKYSREEDGIKRV
jgi:hypothetical protein